MLPVVNGRYKHQPGNRCLQDRETTWERVYKCWIIL